MNAHQRAERLCMEAEKLGLDGPTENMIAEAIHAAQCDALTCPNLYPECDSLFLDDVRRACGPLAERLATDMDHRCKDHSKWYKAVKKVRAQLKPLSQEGETKP